MRALSIVFLFCTTGVFAQLGSPNYAPAASPTTLTIGVQSFGPTVTGSLNGLQTQVDLNSDFGLSKDKTHTGFFVDYQTPGYALQASTGSSEYAGNQVMGQPVALGGVIFPTGTTVQSWMKLTSLNGIWTLKFASDPDTWMGVDLGLQVWTLDLRGTAALSAPPIASSISLKAPIPQVGLSGGSRFYNGAMESKAYVRYMNARGGKYTLIGTDLRMFLTSWFGLRVFYENSHLDAPKGAIKDDLDLRIDCKGMGFGGVIRF
jgi:hypothetical protein